MANIYLDNNFFGRDYNDLGFNLPNLKCTFFSPFASKADFVRTFFLATGIPLRHAVIAVTTLIDSIDEVLTVLKDTLEVFFSAAALVFTLPVVPPEDEIYTLFHQLETSTNKAKISLSILTERLFYTLVHCALTISGPFIGVASLIGRTAATTIDFIQDQADAVEEITPHTSPA